jgi:hypothetical protein
MNACKREFPDVLDPVDVQDGWFELDLMDVKPADSLDPAFWNSMRHSSRVRCAARGAFAPRIWDGSAVPVKRGRSNKFRERM